jgi:hypothetical protein
LNEFVGCTLPVNQSGIAIVNHTVLEAAGMSLLLGESKRRKALSMRPLTFNSLVEVTNLSWLV